MLERLMPDPEPPRKIVPSLVFQSRIDSIVSSTERMKQAEHCGFSSKPTLNQTGELNVGFEEKPQCSACFILSVEDRKSTRLNSSHMSISYAVFCLKKKIEQQMFNSAVRAVDGVAPAAPPDMLGRSVGRRPRAGERVEHRAARAGLARTRSAHTAGI